jgi:hypothetical protein
MHILRGIEYAAGYSALRLIRGVSESQQRLCIDTNRAQDLIFLKSFQINILQLLQGLVAGLRLNQSSR